MIKWAVWWNKHKVCNLIWHHCVALKHIKQTDITEVMPPYTTLLSLWRDSWLWGAGRHQGRLRVLCYWWQFSLVQTFMLSYPRLRWLSKTFWYNIVTGGCTHHWYSECSHHFFFQYFLTDRINSSTNNLKAEIKFLVSTNLEGAWGLIFNKMHNNLTGLQEVWEWMWVISCENMSRYC